ncbi:uncharacterized protein LOC126678020 [Mercurialis annua]|uniref:uncharacterized protein LOC126678020 n=1 Tax=Mercurialis annua TaxID=3986 RepID=UPI00215EEA64|nr:uncharacterized protein LOC126678020 [Mercurialis annua]
MNSISKNSKISLKNNSTKRTSSTTSIFQRRRRRTSVHARRRVCKKSEAKTTKFSSSKVSDKLEALKNLIPANNGDTVKPDQLFQETADYIVLLKTQVFVLQKLIQFYGSNAAEADNNSNAVVL